MSVAFGCSCRVLSISLQGTTRPSFRSLRQRSQRTTMLTIASTGDTLKQLITEYSIQSRVEAQPCGMQLGIFATSAAQTGEVILRVPLEHCLVLDYAEGGLQLPAAGSWPRVKMALEKDDSLPWDVLQGVALVDGLAGDGGPFWSTYCNEVLPEPTRLALPLALPRVLLFDLEHPAIIQGALLQKERLRKMFPGWSKPIQEGWPTWIEWGFACVRSRAFKLREECFALVPVMDVANHSAQPNADFVLADDGGSVELRALCAVNVGEEVTVSYDGQQGFTNQRFMAQYGFVPEDGNSSDRIDLAAVLEQCKEGPGGLLLAHVQDLLGDVLWVEMMSGDNPYLYAALKSLPWLDEEQAQGSSLEATLPLARHLLATLQAEFGSYTTSLEDDLKLLFRPSISHDCRAAAIVRYRYERKKLLSAALVILRAYCRARLDDD